jgi:hypothetical protein
VSLQVQNNPELHCKSGNVDQAARLKLVGLKSPCLQPRRHGSLPQQPKNLVPVLQMYICPPEGQEGFIAWRRLMVNEGDMMNSGRIADREENGEANAIKRHRLRGKETRPCLRPNK